MIPKISASILSLDWSEQTIIDAAVLRITNANYVHFDIMDGKFVKQKTFDYTLVKKTDLSGTGLEKDVHLMIKEPEKHIQKYLKAGANMMSFHIEAVKNPKKLISTIQKKGVLAGIAIDPETPIAKIEPFIELADYVLVMTAHPGKSGQKLLKSTITKVKRIRKKHPEKIIEVDCGLNDKNAGILIDAGANILVSGSYIFNNPSPKLAIDLLRNS